jgi:hypothetical protein
MTQQKMMGPEGTATTRPATRDEWVRELEGANMLDAVLDETRRRSGEAGVLLTNRGTEIADYQAAIFLAQELAAAGMVPKCFELKVTDDKGNRLKNAAGFDRTRPNIPGMALAMLKGRLVGLDALTSIQKIMIVNGIPALHSGGHIAVCLSRPDIFDVAKFEKWFEVDGVRTASTPDPADFQKDSTAAVCRVCRVGGNPYTMRFSVAMAKKSGLWADAKKQYGPYPYRMLMHRADGFAINDMFQDLLLGLAIEGVTTAPEVDGEDDGKPQPNGDESSSAASLAVAVANSKSPALARPSIQESAEQAGQDDEAEPASESEAQQQSEPTAVEVKVTEEAAPPATKEAPAAAGPVRLAADTIDAIRTACREQNIHYGDLEEALGGPLEDFEVKGATEPGQLSRQVKAAMARLAAVSQVPAAAALIDPAKVDSLIATAKGVGMDEADLDSFCQLKWKTNLRGAPAGADTDIYKHLAGQPRKGK